MIDFFSINLRKQNELPVYQQLGEVFYGFIEKGVLKAGNKLPSIRELSKSLNINNDTVINAYKYLEKRKAVYSIKGSGTFVSDLQRSVGTTLLDESPEYKIIASDINNFYNMYGTNVSKTLFPSNHFKYIFAEILENEKGSCFIYDRKSTNDVPIDIKNIFFKQNNIETKDNKFFYTDGSEQNTAYIIKNIARAGESVIGMGFTPASLVEKIISMGCEFYKLDICEKIDITLFERLLKIHKPSAVYIMTNANPSVSYLSNEDKKIILSLAEKYSFYIVEDDSFSCINYQPTAAFPFKSFDSKKRTAYIYSFQKASIPGLPIGFALLPKQIDEPSIITPGPIIKKSLDVFLRNGFIGYMNELQEIFLQKLNCIIEKLTPFDTVTTYSPNGGCVIWLKFADAKTADYICDTLINKKIVVTPGKLHSNAEFFSSVIQIGFGETKYLDINYCMKVITDIILDIRF